MLLGSGLIALGACTTSVTTSDGRPMPRAPREAPEAPEGSRVNAMAMLVANKATDTNGNGYPDQIHVTVHLFALPHQSPIFEPGAMVFALYPPGRAIGPEAQPMLQWRLDAERVSGARTRTLAGPAHVFQLSLVEQGGDQYPLMTGNLTCHFLPADGAAAVASSEAVPVSIGRRM